MSAGLQQAKNFPVRSDENLMFAYHALSAAHDAAEEYMFLSGGRHVHESGIELFISGEIARRLVARQVHVSVPWGRNGSNKLAERIDHTFLVEHAVLEAGGGLVFGDTDDRKKRLDIALITTKAGEGRDQHEAFLGIEVKRHLSEIQKDISKLRDVLLLHERSDWGMTAGAIVCFSGSWDRTRDDPETLLGRRLDQYQQSFDDIDLQACWLERGNPMKVRDLGAGDGETGETIVHPERYKSLAAYCVLLKLSSQQKITGE